MMANDYDNFQLIEINSHSLFSKWFSESGKLVLKLFDNIREFAEDPTNMIFVLIDEVESLAYDRQRINSADPTDAVRVVNAILTQLDSIKQYPNIIILATSNVSKSMDNAFVDRADIIQFVGLPSSQMVYEILRSSIMELIQSRVI
ncbi:ATP binding protein, partial [Euroglyphus maynei]